MFSISGIASLLAGPLLDKLIAPLTDIFKAYLNKQITEAQLREQLQALIVGAFKEVEIEHAEVLARTYASFADVLKSSALIQRVWTAIAVSQLFILVWSQFVVPMLATYSLLPGGWHPGTTADWAYLILLALLGMGPVVLRAGPGARNRFVENVKSLTTTQK